jgi:uncharacterized protein (TIGR02145 family)
MRNEELFFEKEIKRIRDEFGAKYFVKMGFHSVLRDLSPQIERRYYTVLKLADDFEIYKKIVGIKSLEEGTRAINIENIKQQFIEGSGLDRRVASEVFWAFLYGNGITDRGLEIEVERERKEEVKIEDFKTIVIGKQEWMSKNLNVDTFRNGDPIPNAKTNDEWKKAGDRGEPAWCYYDNDPSNGKKYGKLYNWYAVNDPRGLAPEGWKIPSDEEWSRLTDFLGGESVAGTKMKSTDFWADNDGELGNGTNESGFSGLPGGGRTNDGSFFYIGEGGYWWSSTESSTSDAWDRDLGYDNGSVGGSSLNKLLGFSVRCLRD